MGLKMGFLFFFFLAMLASKFPRRSRDTNTGGCKITHVLSALPGGDVYYMNYLFFFIIIILYQGSKNTDRSRLRLACASNMESIGLK